MRRRFGYAEDETVAIVTVGGSGVGAALLKRIIAAIPAARRRLIHGYIADLHLHLAACDIALVQGGLTTCMELTAAKVPFLYFPLLNHFEQNFHVRHRLARYAAGICMDYATATPDEIAAAIDAGLGRRVSYRDVESDGSTRAARLLAELF